MNKELLLQVADAIETQRAGRRRVAFNMESWGHRVEEEDHMCGTVACVAGFTLAIKHPVVFKKQIDGHLDFEERSLIDRAGVDLGLTREQARELFLAVSFGEETYFRPPPGLHIINNHAEFVPDALRWMAATGRIEWKPALEAAMCVAREKEAVAS